MPRIHLDHLNSTPLHPRALAAMKAALELSGNPSSLHTEGRAAFVALDNARRQVAQLLRARSEEITFTSSGTEANTLALRGLSGANAQRGRHLVVSAVEHLSVLQTVRRLEKEGWTASVVGVDSYGRVDLKALEKALTRETVLASIQWANAETGTLQPVEEACALVRSKGAFFHTDAVAAAGQVPVDLSRVPADAVSLAAGSMGGPPGAGALFVRKGVRILPLFLGGSQEEGRRAGTENLPGILGMGAAAEAASLEGGASGERRTSLRDRLIRGILEKVPETGLIGHPTERLPGHVSLSFPSMDGEALILALDQEGIAAGLGSACSHQTLKASHVLKAMGVSTSRALGAVAFTLGRETTEEEIDRVIEILEGFLRAGFKTSRGRAGL
ncbi:MAG: cysteine desulfurase [Candidatus Omnitrophica bacterium]|nr:cysteine desulfurase [Candidatus Omnitrophota bacterium]